MHDELVAFYLPFGPPSASFSAEEDLKRRDDIWHEVRALMPVVDHLPNSRVVDRIGLRDQKFVLNFVLEPSRQISLDFNRGGAETISILLQRDLELLRQSAAAQQKAIFLDASASIPSGFAGSKARRGNQRLHKVMQQYAGQTLVLPFDNGPLALTFPAYPDYRFDGMERTISAFVAQTKPFIVELRGIRYVGDADPASHTLGKTRKRPAVLPFVEERREVGILCAAAQFADVRLLVTVRTALKYHGGSISHFEIVEIQNKMELLSKLGELLPANCFPPEAVTCSCKPGQTQDL